MKLCLYILHLCFIHIKLSPTVVHKNSLSNCDFCENWYNDLNLGVLMDFCLYFPHLLSSLVDIWYMKSARHAVDNFLVS